MNEMTHIDKASNPPSLRGWLEEAPFTLVMSSGFFGFFAHCGMLSVLEEEGLHPRGVAGSSAGALVAGCWAASGSIAGLSDRLAALRRNDFWDPGLGFGLLQGKLFRNELENLFMGVAMEDCPVPISVSIFDVKKRKTETVSTGNLASAVQASCAFPFLFQPVKRDGKKYLDGGIGDRPGLLGVPLGTRTLYHHLSSRSPWRRTGSHSLKTPVREGLVSLVIDGLPRVNPFRLERGQIAFELAKKTTQTALDRPLQNGLVRVHTD